MVDTKMFTKKKEKELQTLMQPIWIYNQVIGTKFGFEKCAIVI